MVEYKRRVVLQSLSIVYNSSYKKLHSVPEFDKNPKNLHDIVNKLWIWKKHLKIVNNFLIFILFLF